MNYQQDWTDEFDEASDVDRADSAEVDADVDDPEAIVAGDDGAVPEEADPADAVDQALEVPEDEDDEAPPD
ncbi:hypothetical protein GCM10027447_17750 [Glycomyces halotolerans]